MVNFFIFLKEVYMKRRIMSHSNVDFDCLLGTYLAEKYFVQQGDEVTIIFDSNCGKGEFEIKGGDVFVDMFPSDDAIRPKKESYYLFDHHEYPYLLEESASNAVFKNLYNSNPVYARLVEEANNEDHLRDLSYNGINIRWYLNYLKETLKDDYKVYEEMKKLFDYIVSIEEKRVKAKEEFEKMGGKIEEVKEKKIAIIEGELNSYMTGWLYDGMGVNFIIYKDGLNIGILRSVNESFHLGVLKNRMTFANKDKWFAHPEGFILCWGSKKYPATEDSGVSVEDLFKLLVSCL